MGEKIFKSNGFFQPSSFSTLASYIWYNITGTQLKVVPDGPKLGEFDGVSYYLLHEGEEERSLTSDTLQKLCQSDDTFQNSGKKKIIYGSCCLVNNEELTNERVEFRQIPFRVPGYKLPVLPQS